MYSSLRKVLNRIVTGYRQGPVKTRSIQLPVKCGVGFDWLDARNSLFERQFLEERQRQDCSSVCRDAFRRSFLLMIATST